MEPPRVFLRDGGSLIPDVPKSGPSHTPAAPWWGGGRRGQAPFEAPPAEKREQQVVMCSEIKSPKRRRRGSGQGLAAFGSALASPGLLQAAQPPPRAGDPAELLNLSELRPHYLQNRDNSVVYYL